MAPHPTIRRATVADWPSVKAARLTALADSPDAFGSTLAREAAFADSEWRLRVGSGNWFVALEHDEVIGLVATITEAAAPTERHLVGMWVRPESRGGPTATELVDAVCHAARADGILALTLWVADGNVRAGRFYERMGFRSTGLRQPLPSNPARGEEYLRKDLIRG
jgi:ribosomal protein S18 acetylase RimI-like enzyme